MRSAFKHSFRHSGRVPSHQQAVREAECADDRQWIELIKQTSSDQLTNDGTFQEGAELESESESEKAS